MNVNFEKLKLYLFYTLIITGIIFCVVAFNSSHESLKFDNEPIYAINNNWSYIDETGKTTVIDLPAKLEGVENKKVTISRLLTNDLDDLSALCIRTSQQSINVYIDKQLIYSYGDVSEKPLFGKAVGRNWNIITLPNGSIGKIITLEITAAYSDYSGTISPMYGGTKVALIFNIFKLYGVKFLLSVFILIIGVFLIIVHVIFRNLFNTKKPLLYLGLFSILISMFLLCESKVIQFIIGNQLLVFPLAVLGLITFPIPLLQYVYTIENYRFKKPISFLVFLLCLNAYIMIILQTFNITDFHDGLLLSHILIVCSSAIVLITLFVELFKYNNYEIKSLTISFSVLFFSCMLELIFYYINPIIVTGVFIQFGILFLITTLSWEAIKKSIYVIKLSREAQYYETLATKDFLTKCKNRTAFINEVASIIPTQNVGIIVIDINNLKYINDTFGHHIGDDAIIQCSKCIEKAFLHTNNAYRTGGDEFVLIEYNCHKAILEGKISKFIEECKKENANCTYEFQVAIGYTLYDKTLDIEIQDTLKRADKNMYDMKNTMKEYNK